MLLNSLIQEKSLKSITTENVEVFVHSRETWTLFQKRKLMKGLALVKRMLQPRQKDCAEDHLNLGLMTLSVYFVIRYVSILRVQKQEKNLYKLYGIILIHLTRNNIFKSTKSLTGGLIYNF